MSDELIQKPTGKMVFLVPVSLTDENWLQSALNTTNNVAKRANGTLQMRGVGNDSESLAVMRESVFSQMNVPFFSFGWLGKNDGGENVGNPFPEFLGFVGNIAGGAGILIGQRKIIETIATKAGEGLSLPKQAGGCPLFRIDLDTSDRVVTVTRETGLRAAP